MKPSSHELQPGSPACHAAANESSGPSTLLEPVAEAGSACSTTCGSLGAFYWDSFLQLLVDQWGGGAGQGWTALQTHVAHLETAMCSSWEAWQAVVMRRHSLLGAHEQQCVRGSQQEEGSGSGGSTSSPCALVRSQVSGKGCTAAGRAPDSLVLPWCCCTGPWCCCAAV